MLLLQMQWCHMYPHAMHRSTRQVPCPSLPSLQSTHPPPTRLPFVTAASFHQAFHQADSSVSPLHPPSTIPQRPPLAAPSLHQCYPVVLMIIQGSSWPAVQCLDILKNAGRLPDQYRSSLWCQGNHSIDFHELSKFFSIRVNRARKAELNLARGSSNAAKVNHH